MSSKDTQFTRENAAENGRKGGLASVAARREKRDMKRWAQIIGEKHMKVSMPDGTTEDGDILGMSVLRLYSIILGKHTKDSDRIAAIRALQSLLGESTENINITQPLTPEQIVAMARKARNDEH